MTERVARPPDVPRWDDDYLDAVARRLWSHYDLEREFRVAGESFDLYGNLRIETERHAFHPTVRFARHHSNEYLFVRREPRPRVETLKALESLGETIADDWIDADERHFSTDFTFVVVAREIPNDVGEFVEQYRNRTLLKFGYYGHYEINLVVVAPDRKQLVSSDSAGVAEAFRTWQPIEHSEPGRLGRFLDWITR
ncbi:hypothetical protein CV102_04965 [Natronococcus pandeyae]|uniref:DUF8052 domain-containing protein n=1 Tax=Natronococcus pandeyae TaxID=2055836 RepID=A0A8J8TRX4_9EURY|nr:hypothetical protein CV102_04965 [Natronococcus pandeyae]